MLRPDTPEMRVLLELAAKAAGLTLEWRHNWRGNGLDEPWHDGNVWEPQSDDGQSRRLQVICGLALVPLPIMGHEKTGVNCKLYESTADVYRGARQAIECCEPFSAHADAAAAARWAVLRAAAEMGSRLP